MSLKSRVKKAKGLIWSHSPRNPSHYGTWGSNKKNYYDIDLSHNKITINTMDGEKLIRVLEVKCQQNDGLIHACSGNSKHNTVCYHGLARFFPCRGCARSARKARASPAR